MICINCSCCESVCECGDEQELEESYFCENCGTIASLDQLNEDGFCDEDACVEAHEDYRDTAVSFIMDTVS